MASKLNSHFTADLNENRNRDVTSALFRVPSCSYSFFLRPATDSDIK